jgi:hypothetical protein
MDKVANLPTDERRDLFRESAARRGMSPAIVEKDFWVCWVLKKLFADAYLKDQMVFKGGTTLSKVFKLINRFSEDIDLVLDWRLLGYGLELEDPGPAPQSNTQRDRFNKQINARAAKYIAGELLARLSNLFRHVPGIVAAMDKSDSLSVNIGYPAAFEETYLRPQVRLEMGPLASWVPSAPHTIQPYAAEDFPRVFDDSSCHVIAIAAERTFWEKATILHQQAHRMTEMPSRYSRHYYDLYRLAKSGVKERALSNLKSLADVVTFKQRFYPSAWSRYELAQPGSFRLIPNQSHLVELQKDYREMQLMIFGEVPSFDAILRALGTLEADINGGAKI